MDMATLGSLVGLAVLADTLPRPTSILSTSRGSNFVGDSPTVEPEREVPSDISGFDWKEEMEEEVSSVMEGMKGVLSWVAAGWGMWGGAGAGVGGNVGSELVPLVDTKSIDLWIP